MKRALNVKNVLLDSRQQTLIGQNICEIIFKY